MRRRRLIALVLCLGSLAFLPSCEFLMAEFFTVQQAPPPLEQVELEMSDR